MPGPRPAPSMAATGPTPPVVHATAFDERPSGRPIAQYEGGEPTGPLPPTPPRRSSGSTRRRLGRRRRPPSSAVLEHALDRARKRGVGPSAGVTTDSLNTLPSEAGPPFRWRRRRGARRCAPTRPGATSGGVDGPPWRRAYGRMATPLPSGGSEHLGHRRSCPGKEGVMYVIYVHHIWAPTQRIRLAAVRGGSCVCCGRAHRRVRLQGFDYPHPSPEERRNQRAERNA